MVPLLLNNPTPIGTASEHFAYIQEELGIFLGYTAAPSDPVHVADVLRLARAGLRQFWNPPLLPGQASRYRWSFAKATATLNLVAGVNSYVLPASFGGLIGSMYFGSEESTIRVESTTISTILDYRQRTALSLRPRFVAIVSAGGPPGAPQRYRAEFYPNPDTTYALAYRYSVQPDAFTSTEPWPPGLVEHVETVLESCLSIAEERRNGERGLHYTKFLERLQASIADDVHATAPEYFGSLIEQDRKLQDDSDEIPDFYYNGVKI